MSKIILLASRLQFLSLGTGKIHAQDSRYVSTLCGRAIPSGVEVRPQREMSTNNLCGRCTASLLTYTGRMGHEPIVKVEREEVTG